MDLVSTCPLRVGGRVWHAMHGGFTLTLACKATFVLHPGLSQLAPEQDTPNEDDNYWDDNPARSLYAPTDLAPYKPRADVVLVGHAFAPGRVPVPSFMVHMIVGEIDKSIEVFGDRSWSADGSLIEGARVARVPLRYERAAGGPGTWNPVGVRVDGPADAYGRIALPNLQPPGHYAARRGDFIEPIGYGPIAPTWPTRAEKIRPFAGAWDHRRWYERPLPEGLDASFFNVAPRDQQVNELRENERIVLENLHPEHPRLATNLPGLRPRVVAERASGRREEVALTADTMWIDTERGLCSLVWRGRINLSHPQEAGRITVDMEEPRSAGPRSTWGDHNTNSPPRPNAALRPSSPPPASERPRPTRTLNLVDEVTQVGPLGGGRNVMPFMQQSAAETPQPAPAAPPRTGSFPGLPFAQMSTPAAPTFGTPPPLIRTPLPVEEAAPAQPPPPAATPWASAVPAETAAKVSIGQRAVAEAAQPASPAVPAPVDRLRSTASASVSTPNPAPSAPRASQQAARLSAVAASDAAALASAQAAQAPAEPAAQPGPQSASRSEPRPATSDHYVDLLWFDKALPKRVRAQANFADALREPKEASAWLTLEDTQQPKQEIKDRRDVVRVLRRVSPVDADGVMRAVAEAIDDEGSLAPPLVVVAGEIQLFFHEIDTLKATIAVASPLAGADKRLREVLDAANELVESDWRCTALAAESMTSRLREAFVQANRSLPGTYLDQNVERVLLEQRGYQKRVILGDKRLRAAIVPEGSTAPIPCYLPEELEAKLPLFQRFRVAVIAEARGQQDQYESHPLALIVFAFGRVLPTPGRR